MGNARSWGPPVTWNVSLSDKATTTSLGTTPICFGIAILCIALYLATVSVEPITGATGALSIVRLVLIYGVIAVAALRVGHRPRKVLR